ncbi:MAG: hypothetical protein JW803_00870 [Endomicrobiales bacterium]|nr:hypothetical protein [Endomicrobiales bacterium]
MKPISSMVIEKLNKVENFTLRYDGGRNILWDINAPGLNVLLVAYQYIKYTGEKGKAALVHHSIKGDFFTKAYDIFGRAGLTRSFLPEVWGYMRELNKYADISGDPEVKANANIQLLRFIQEFMEKIIYEDFISKSNEEITEYSDIFKKLLVAGDSFVAATTDGKTQIFAGYPWFDQAWARDTFVSMNGILLIPERYNYARSVFECYVKNQNREGLLPNTIFVSGRKDYNTADGSLWFIEALNRYRIALKSRESDVFIKKMIPTVNRILDCYIKPAGDIHLDKDSLVVVPAQWTWMDAAPKGKPVTPRNGKPVEIQALFYNALAVASDLNYFLGDRRRAEKYEELKKAVARSVNARYFEHDRVYPYDVLDGDEHCDTVRPNAVFLLSLSKVEDLLPMERKLSILDVIEKELLTPYGLRTLTPHDPKYIGNYDTFASQDEKDLAYHQGSVWPYLLSHYLLAKMRVSKDVQETTSYVKKCINSLIYAVKDKDTLPELFSGDQPHKMGGAVSQAWSVAALTEMLYFLNIEANSRRK